MAKKTKNVAKFGGVDELGKVSLDLHSGVDGKKNEYDASTVEAKSNTNLEMDTGEGNAVVIRCFTFQIDLSKADTWLEKRPSKQEIFNSHLRGIEMGLFGDGLKIYDMVAPRITFDAVKMQYSIFVPAIPRRGIQLNERPQTLTELAHG